MAGIPHFWDEDTVCAAADSFCRTTHADPRCVASCLVVALCVSRLLRGEDTEDIMESVARPAMAKARAECALSEEWDEEMQRHAEGELSDLNLDERKTIGYTFKCLGAGLWALRSSGSFESVLNQLILAAGDADTNGTVAGALLGCRLGFSQLPKDLHGQKVTWTWVKWHLERRFFI